MIEAIIGVTIIMFLLIVWTYYCFKPEIDEWINKYLE